MLGFGGGFVDLLFSLEQLKFRLLLVNVQVQSGDLFALLCHLILQLLQLVALLSLLIGKYDILVFDLVLVLLLSLLVDAQVELEDLRLLL